VLASYAVNVGTKSGHDCTCGSTGTMLRMHSSFKEVGEKPFDLGYAIVDPSVAADPVARDAKAIKPENRGAQLCTTPMPGYPRRKRMTLGKE